MLLLGNFWETFGAFYIPTSGHTGPLLYHRTSSGFFSLHRRRLHPALLRCWLHQSRSQLLPLSRHSGHRSGHGEQQQQQQGAGVRSRFDFCLAAPGKHSLASASRSIFCLNIGVENCFGW